MQSQAGLIEHDGVALQRDGLWWAADGQAQKLRLRRGLDAHSVKARPSLVAKLGANGVGQVNRRANGHFRQRGRERIIDYAHLADEVGHQQGQQFYAQRIEPRDIGWPARCHFD